jgi:hypothetical protein
MISEGAAERRQQLAQAHHTAEVAGRRYAPHPHSLRPRHQRMGEPVREQAEVGDQGAGNPLKMGT